MKNPVQKTKQILNREFQPSEDTKNQKEKEQKLKDEIEQLINKYSRENNSDTPDFLLAEYLIDCLKAFEKITNKRDLWYSPLDEDM